MTDHSTIKFTALHKLHLEIEAKMVDFAGYSMPLSYPTGIIKEHLHTREEASLFDISHMGQISVIGENASNELEKLMPIDVQSITEGTQRYALLLNDAGGILDDLMVACLGANHYHLVVNAACKNNDFLHMQSHISNDVQVGFLEHRSLLALQGPASEQVLLSLGGDVSAMVFMDVKQVDLKGIPCLLSRSGYTGEDGFEISVEENRAIELAIALSEHPQVNWAGLGSRDSLRLEAGLCLYGHDMNEITSPVEASLFWAITKSRRVDGSKAGAFPGANIILNQKRQTVEQIRVGLKPEGKAPVREGAVLQNADGEIVGRVTSGGYSPSAGYPIAMGYVSPSIVDQQTPIFAQVRNKQIPMQIVSLPFVKHQYKR